MLGKKIIKIVGEEYKLTLIFDDKSMLEIMGDAYNGLGLAVDYSPFIEK